MSVRGQRRGGSQPHECRCVLWKKFEVPGMWLQAAATAARAARKAAASCGKGDNTPGVSTSAADTASCGGAAVSAALEQVAAKQAEALMSAGRLVGRGLTAAEARLVQRFDPAGPRDTPGFFIAKFRKRQP